MEIFDFFQGLDTEASNFILIVALISFLLGLIIMALLRGSRIRKLRKALRATENELGKANAEIESLKKELKLKDDELERLKYDLHEANLKAERLETDRTRFYNEAFQLKEKLEVANTSIEDLNKEISELQLENEKLSSQKELLKETLDKTDTETNGLAQMQSVFLATKKQLESMEERLHRVEQENVILKEQITTIPSHSSLSATQPNSASTAVVTESAKPTNISLTEIDADLVDEEPVVKIHDEKPGLDRKIDASEYDRDNLTLIEGVGPFLEKKLNDIGIFSFAQIAALSTEEIQQLTRNIGHIPGRIEQDDWVGQAAKLNTLKIENPTAVERSITAVATPSPDDLTIIEGIGEQLQAILKNAGINTWEDLAETDQDQLSAILVASGPGYQIVDTGSWPAQAQLAINGEWDLLNEYKEELNGE